MPEKNADLHGGAPDKSRVALLLIDVVNDLEFPEGKTLLKFALPMAERLANFKQAAKRSRVPVIYVNDNFGRWRSDFRSQIDHCLHDGVVGQPLAELLHPEEDDYFVLKPKHSAFYSTTLDLLLTYLQVKTLIVTGIASNICVLFTANDAYMRDYGLIVPADGCVANTPALHDAALEQIASVLKADTRQLAEIMSELPRLKNES